MSFATERHPGVSETTLHATRGLAQNHTMLRAVQFLSW
jgi:hypothetical protein